MKYRKLGRTGIEVSEVGMGGLFISEGKASFNEGVAAVRRALELGLNYVDTAPNYYNSEEVLGVALEGACRPYVLSTKIGGRPRPFDARDLKALKVSVADSLRLLCRDYN